MVRNISIVILNICLEGCVYLPIPHEECERPEISGVIVDLSNKPITNVNAILELPSTEPISLITDTNGYFKLSPKCERKIWYFIVMDPAFCDVKLLLSHPDYKEKEICINIFVGSNRTIDYGNIILEKR